MAVRVGQSLELTDALWDLVPVVVAAGEHHDRMAPGDVADASAAGRRLNEDARVRVRQAAREWADQAHTALDTAEWDESAAASLTLADIVADPFGNVASLVDLPSVAAEIKSALGAGLTSVDEGLYYFSYLRSVARSRRTRLLLRALFVTAVGTVEPLVARMVHLLLHHTQPHAYPSLADPDLDKKARELCYGPPRKWRETLVDTFGIAKLADAIDWDRLDDLWEDRNAIGHRGGVVDARHSSKSGAEVGTVLSPEPDDVQSVIDEIGAARYGIVTAVWDHIEPGTGGTLAEESRPTVWESLRAGRSRLAEGLGRVQEVFASDPEAVAAARVHQWLALDRSLGAEAIGDQVQAWDVSSLSPAFTMARHILLRRDDDALSLLSDLLADGSITSADLDNWPLFDRLREEGRLAGLAAP